jgi:hypothetical protein
MTHPADIDAAAFSGAPAPSGLSDDEKVAYEQPPAGSAQNVFYGPILELVPERGRTPGRPRCYLSRMPRDIDVVGVWHGTPYQVASVSSTATGLIVACGPAGRHPTYPKTGHRPTKDPSSGTGTWYERQVLSDVTLAQPLQVIAFSGAKPPAWAKPHADRPSHDSFTFQALADGHVRLALVGVREADDAVILVTKQAATAPRLFRRHAPNVLLWTVPSDKA